MLIDRPQWTSLVEELGWEQVEQVDEWIHPCASGSVMAEGTSLPTTTIQTLVQSQLVRSFRGCRLEFSWVLRNSIKFYPNPLANLLWQNMAKNTESNGALELEKQHDGSVYIHIYIFWHINDWSNSQNFSRQTTEQNRIVWTGNKIMRSPWPSKMQQIQIQNLCQNSSKGRKYNTSLFNSHHSHFLQFMTHLGEKKKNK